MQKKLIALAVASVISAPAFAGVNVYGIVDAALVNKSVTGANSHMTILSGGLSTSRLGVVADEDLDNGMKAIAKVEYKLDVAAGAPVAPAVTSTGDGIGSARQEMLALAGGFGTVAAGTLQTTGLDWAVKFNPVAGSAVDSLQAVNVGLLVNVGSRATHALAYISPDLGGVTVAYNRAFDAADQGNSAAGKITANLLSATYSAGPLAVGGVYAGAEAKDGGAGSKTTELALGASYDLGAAKLFGTYQTFKTDATNATTDKALSLSVVAPVGPGAIVGSFAKNTVAGTGNDDSSLTAAYLMGLSKTTTAYAALQKLTAKTANVSTDTTVVAVGVKKAF